MRKLILTIVFSACAFAAVAGPYDPLDPCVLSSGDEAIAACTRFLKAPGDDKDGIPIAYTARGRAYYEKQQYDQAIADLNQALALAPRSREAHFWRAFALTSADKDVEAIPDYDVLLALDPKDPYAGGATMLCWRGAAYLKKGGEDARGFADIDKAIALKPDDLYCYEKKADAYKERKNVEQEIATLDKMISVMPKDPKIVNAYDRRAERHIERGDNDKALADYAAEIEADPTRPWGFSARARLLEKLGRLDQAIADYDKLISLKPDDKDYPEYRARLIKAKDSAPAKAAPAAAPAPAKAEECSWWSSLLVSCAKTAP